MDRDLFVTGYRPMLGCFETDSYVACSIKCAESLL
jgi:hypothetical protein